MSDQARLDFYKEKMAKVPEGSSYGIPKKSVQVKLTSSSSAFEVNKFKNNLVKVIGEQTAFIYD